MFFVAFDRFLPIIKKRAKVIEKIAAMREPVESWVR
jgi:hypothetical protein